MLISGSHWSDTEKKTADFLPKVLLFLIGCAVNSDAQTFAKGMRLFYSPVTQTLDSTHMGE